MSDSGSQMSDRNGGNDEVLQAIAALKEEMAAMEARLREHVHDTETRLVNEFYKWTRITEARLRGSEAIKMSERLDAIEGRLLDVERRLATP